ncbi:MAG: methyltetrahydrofolate cobalamin methyltransferase [Proteobacteria bacterium]|nr:methyltetrahydrofolate cobalamin methyltransferase [Pseudomonadota bacterium]
MKIIGEKINGTRAQVRTAIVNRDANFIKGLAEDQVRAGVDFLDVNAGTTPDREPDDLVWLVKTVQEAVDISLCIDSTNTVALTAALNHVKQEPMINSISGDKERLENMLPIVVKHNCTVIALALDESGIPKNVEDRMKVLKRVFNATRDAGISDEKVYADPLIMTIGTDTQAGLMALESIRAIKREYPRAHITSGLSNISFGLPARSLINRTFLTLAMEAGLDSAIVDPTNQALREALIVTELLLGQDKFCRRYTQAFRSGLIAKNK